MGASSSRSRRIGRLTASLQGLIIAKPPRSFPRDSSATLGMTGGEVSC